VINGMENNNLMMFTTLLQLESTNRIKTTELKQFVGNVAHDLKVSIEKIITLSPLSIIIRNI
jgi:adenylate cyclase